MSTSLPQRLPHPAGVIGALAGSGVALAPGSLPREVTVHVALLTCFVLIGAGVGTLIGRAMTGRHSTRSPWDRTMVVGVAATAFGGLLAANMWWQDTLRDAVGMPDVGIGWFAASLVPAGLYAALVVAPRMTVVAVGTVIVTAVGVAPSGASAQSEAHSRAAEFVSADASPTSMRLYSALDDRDVDARADDLVARWAGSGGVRRSAVVIAVPTGSGWVDPDAIRGFEERLGGDTAVIALQYSDIPSWQAFLTSADTARSSAIAMTSALLRTVDRLPIRTRPQVYLYGQSLGAIGADAARAWVDDRHASICATVLAGSPAGSVATHASRRVVLANSSDPVVRWSPRLIWAPPDLPTEYADSPQPVWLPFASFVQASADLLGALSFPAGHGHQYGTEQGTAAPLCGGQTGRDQASGPRAVSYAAPTR